MVVGDDPDKDVLSVGSGGFNLAPRDAASPFFRHETVAVRDDAYHHIGFSGLAFTFGYRLAGQRTEALHRHGFLREAQDSVVGHAAVFD